MKSRLIRTVAALVLSTPVAVALAGPAAAGGGFCRGQPVTDTSTDRVVMAENCFTPTIVRIDVGQSVTWTNKDGTAHAVVGANASWGEYDDIAQGGRTTVRFDESGVYPYFCHIHPGMIGAVVVGDGSASSGSSVAVVPPAPSTQPTAVPQDRAAAGRFAESSAWKVATFVAAGLLIGLAVWVAVGRRIAGRIREDRRNLSRSLS
jgi:plastocyanin